MKNNMKKDAQRSTRKNTLKNRLILIIGFLTLITPILGIPNLFQDWMIFAYGLILISIVIFEYFSAHAGNSDDREVDDRDDRDGGDYNNGEDNESEPRFSADTFEESFGDEVDKVEGTQGEVDREETENRGEVADQEEADEDQK